MARRPAADTGTAVPVSRNRLGAGVRGSRGRALGGRIAPGCPGSPPGGGWETRQGDAWLGLAAKSCPFALFDAAETTIPGHFSRRVRRGGEKSRTNGYHFCRNGQLFQQFSIQVVQ